MPQQEPITSQISDSSSMSPKSALLLYAKGIAMGLGDSVPGVSGGTIAVITHIYDKLIFSIKSIDLQAIKFLFSGQLASAWRHVNGSFLLLLLLGVLTGLLVSANSVLYLLENQFEALMAFFIGLVLASTWLLKEQFDFKKPSNLIVMVLGFGVTAMVSFLSPQVVELSLPYVFFSGLVAICAMILPGLSGAFILILLGVYEFILTALTQFDIAYIAVFVAGCLIGILTFSRLLAWLLKKYHQLSYGFISGMLLGSLLVLWPWQRVLTTYTDSSGEIHSLQTSNVSPFNYSELTGNDAMFLMSLIFAVLGVAAVLLLDHFFSHKDGENMA